MTTRKKHKKMVLSRVINKDIRIIGSVKELPKEGEELLFIPEGKKEEIGAQEIVYSIEPVRIGRYRIYTDQNVYILDDLIVLNENHRNRLY